MSRGPGRVQREILAELERVKYADRSTSQLAKIIYGTEPTTEAQMRAVRRALRQLEAQGLIRVRLGSITGRETTIRRWRYDFKIDRGRWVDEPHMVPIPELIAWFGPPRELPADVIERDRQLSGVDHD